MAEILYDCLVYEPDICNAICLETEGPSVARSSSSIWQILFNPLYWLRVWGNNADGEEDNASLTVTRRDWRIAASKEHEVVVVMQRKVTNSVLYFRTGKSSFLATHEEEVPAPSSCSSSIALALSDEGRYCAVWNGQLWIFEVLHNMEDSSEGDGAVPLVKLQFTQSHFSHTASGSKSLAVAMEGRRTFRRLNKSLWPANGSVLHMEFYRLSPEDQWQLLVLLENGMHVYQLQMGEEKTLTVERTFDCRGMSMDATGDQGSKPKNHITAFTTHSKMQMAVVACGGPDSSLTLMVTKMSFSPDGSKLMTLDRRGGLYIYRCHHPDIPQSSNSGLHLRRRTRTGSTAADLQKGDDTEVLCFPNVPGLFPGNEKATLHALIAFTPFVVLEQPREAAAETTQRRHRKGKATVLADASWWSDDALALVQSDGYLTVNSVTDGHNLLGSSAEKFRGPCLLTPAHCDVDEVAQPRKMFVWECERQVTGGSSGQKARSVSCICRLVCFRETPPAQLLRLKVQQGQFDAALQLATLHNLDRDIVFKTRWLMSPIQSTSIKQFLEPVSDVQWKLEQCCRAVAPSDFLQQALLRYGLDLSETLLNRDTSLQDKEEDTPEEDSQVWWALKPTWALPLEAYRLVLQLQMDRFNTFQTLTHGAYDPPAWMAFRDCSLRQYATTLARSRQLKQLTQLFRLHPEEVQPHIFEVLSAIPHTVKPDEYIRLLPVDSVILEHADGLPGRRSTEVYWVEHSPQVIAVVKNVLPGLVVWHPDHGALGSEDEHPALNAPTLDAMAQWVKGRAEEIDVSCGRIDLAVELVKIAMDRGLPGLEGLKYQLHELVAIVYVAGQADMTLRRYQCLPADQQLQFLTSDLSSTNYQDVVLNRVVPFLHHFPEEERASLMTNWMLILTEKDPPVWQQIMADCILDPRPLAPLLEDGTAVLQVGVACLQQVKNGTEISSAMRVLQLLYQLLSNEGSDQLHHQLDELSCRFAALTLFQKYGVASDLQQVQAMEGQPSKCLVCLRKMMNRDPRASNKRFKALLEDLFRLRLTTFSCLSAETVLMTFCQTLLSLERFDLCASYLFRSATQYPELAPPVQGQWLDTKAGNESHAGDSLASHHYFQKISNLTAKTIAHTIGSGSSEKEEMYGLGADLSAQLVMDCARNFFNSSVSVSDSSLHLAALCLDLLDTADSSLSIPTSNQKSADTSSSASQPLREALQAERNLLACCSAIAQGFNFNLLPIQLRGVDDLELIMTELLSKNEKAYLLIDELHRISDLLGLPQKHAQVTLLAAKEALAKHDYSACHDYCRTLMKANNKDIVPVCQALYATAEYLAPDKLELLGYVMAHAEASQLPAALEHFCVAEQVLANRLVIAGLEDAEDGDLFLAKWQNLVQDFLADINSNGDPPDAADIADPPNTAKIAPVVPYSTQPQLPDEIPLPSELPEAPTPVGMDPLAIEHPSTAEDTVTGHGVPEDKESESCSLDAEDANMSQPVPSLPSSPASVSEGSKPTEETPSQQSVLHHPDNTSPASLPMWEKLLLRLGPQVDTKQRAIDIDYVRHVLTAASLVLKDGENVPLASRSVATYVFQIADTPMDQSNDIRVMAELLECFGNWMGCIETELVSDEEKIGFHSTFEMIWQAVQLAEHYMEDTDAAPVGRSTEEVERTPVEGVSNQYTQDDDTVEPEDAVEAIPSPESEVGTPTQVTNAMEGETAPAATPISAEGCLDHLEHSAEQSDNATAPAHPTPTSTPSPSVMSHPKNALQSAVEDRPDNIFNNCASIWAAVLAKMELKRDLDGKPIDLDLVRRVVSAASLVIADASSVRQACRYVAVFGFNVPFTLNDASNDAYLTSKLLNSFGKWLGTVEEYFSSTEQLGCYHLTYDAVWKALGLVEDFEDEEDEEDEEEKDSSKHAAGDGLEDGKVQAVEGGPENGTQHAVHEVQEDDAVQVGEDGGAQAVDAGSGNDATQIVDDVPENVSQVSEDGRVQAGEDSAGQSLEGFTDDGGTQAVDEVPGNGTKQSMDGAPESNGAQTVGDGLKDATVQSEEGSAGQAGEDSEAHAEEGSEAQAGEDSKAQTAEESEAQTGKGGAGQAGEYSKAQAREDDAGEAGEDSEAQAGKGNEAQAGEDDAGQAGEDSQAQTGEDGAGQAGEDDAGQAGEDDAGQAGEDDAGQAAGNGSEDRLDTSPQGSIEDGRHPVNASPLAGEESQTPLEGLQEVAVDDATTEMTPTSETDKGGTSKPEVHEDRGVELQSAMGSMPLTDEPPSGTSNTGIPKTKAGLLQAVVERKDNPYFKATAIWEAVFARVGTEKDIDNRRVDLQYVQQAIGIASLVAADAQCLRLASRCAAVCLFNVPLAVNDFGNDVYLAAKFLRAFSTWLQGASGHFVSAEECECYAEISAMVDDVATQMEDFEEDEEDEEDD